MKSQVARIFAAVLVISMCVSVITSSAQDRWEPAKGPYNGRVFAVMVLDNQDILVGIESGGYYRSTDGGLTWSYGGLATETVRTFFRHSSGALYAGLQTGLRISTDNGTTWESPSLPVSINGFGIIETPTGDVFVGGWGAVVKSTDDGTTWAEVDLGVSNPRVNEMFASSSGVVFAGLHNGGLLMSEDDGATWHQADTLYKYDSFTAFAEVGGTILAYSTSNGFLRSTDNGTTWAESQGAMISCHCVVVLPGQELLAGGQGSIMHSTDLGQNWQKTFDIPGDFTVEGLARNQGGRIIAGTMWGGLYYSDDNGVSWTKSSVGFTGTMIMSMDVNSSGDVFIIHPASPPMRTSDKGQTWTPVPGAEVADSRLFVSADDVLYVTRRNQGVYHTSDNGATWVADTAGLPKFTYTCVGANDLGDIYVGGSNSECYVLKGGQGTWTDLSGKVGTGYITDFAFTTDAVFATSTQDGLYRSMDRGTTWEKLNEGMSEYYILSVSVDQRGMVYLGAHHGVYKSTDNGDTWTKVGSSISGTASAVAFSNNGLPFAATRYNGVYMWNPMTKDWEPLEEGMDNPDVRFFVVDASGTLYAGTDGNGVYTRNAPTVGIPDLPHVSGISIVRAYPNPFSSTATIIYSSRSAAPVTLTVYNTLGVPVRTILRDAQPGENTVQLDDLKPGLYMLVLQGMDGVATRMIIGR